MSVYHEADIQAFIQDAFVYEGDIAESTEKITTLFSELGIDMYFDGEVDEKAIAGISIDTVLSTEEVTDMIRESMHDMRQKSGKGVETK